jgi:hypothetical protein
VKLWRRTGSEGWKFSRDFARVHRRAVRSLYERRLCDFFFEKEGYVIGLVACTVLIRFHVEQYGVYSKFNSANSKIWVLNLNFGNPLSFAVV